MTRTRSAVMGNGMITGMSKRTRDVPARALFFRRFTGRCISSATMYMRTVRCAAEWNSKSKAHRRIRDERRITLTIRNTGGRLPCYRIARGSGNFLLNVDVD